MYFIRVNITWLTGWHRPTQPVARGQNVAHDTVILLTETFEMRKGLLTLYPAKPRQKAKTFWKRMICFFIETYITLLINFVKMC